VSLLEVVGFYRLVFSKVFVSKKVAFLLPSLYTRPYTKHPYDFFSLSDII